MEKCPPEIHARIFTFACTDDGVTGQSLSLVSKYVRQVSQPYQWQIIALTSYTRVQQFARLLDRGHHQHQPTQPARPIYHLFLSDRHPVYQPGSGPTYLDPFMQYDNVFAPAMTAVLRYAAPTLRTLSFFSDACFVNGAMAVRYCLAIPYPRLTELTVRACCTPSQLAGTRSGEVLPCDTPRLARLHLALPYHGFSSDNLQATHNLVRSFSSPSPSSTDNDKYNENALTHLRFTMLDKWGSRRVVEVIHSELAQAGLVAQVLDLPPSDWDSPRTATAQPVTWDRLLPAGLAVFAIQPSPTSTFYCSCCMDLRGDVDVMRILERMADLADKARFVYMHRRPIRVRRCRTDPMEVAGYGYLEAKCDWLERLGEGGGGCWRQRDEVDGDGDGEEADGSHGRAERLQGPAAVGLLVPKRRPTLAARLRSVLMKLKVW